MGRKGTIMFLESLLETSAPAKKRRGWATVTSFLIEAAVVGLLILLPLLYTDALPMLGWGRTTVIGPPAGEARPTPDRTVQGTKPRPVRNVDTGIHVPDRIPVGVAASTDHDPPPNEADETPCTGLCVPGSIGSGGNNPLIDRMLEGVRPEPARPEPRERVPVISTIAEGMLIRRVQPIYPRLAIEAHIQGQVVLRAVIGRDGMIHGLDALRGHPLLIPAAVDAVRQWQYRPYFLNGQPVEVETQVTVNFVLNR